MLISDDVKRSLEVAAGFLMELTANATPDTPDEPGEPLAVVEPETPENPEPEVEIVPAPVNEQQWRIF